MWPVRRLVKYGLVAGATIGTVASLKANQYNVDSIGVVRLGRAATTVFNIGLHYKQALYGSKLERTSKEYQELKSAVHREAAKKLLELCCTNRGVYIKVGQHIGALDYLVPPEYVETMKVLHSQAPRSTMEEVYKVLREDLKQDPFEIFSDIETEPIGAASLAQVHKATLKDGTVVAVKVQHPYVRGNSRVDMKTMEVPQIYWDLSTSRVLTMEYLEGGQVNDLAYIRSNNISAYEVADKLSRLYSQMIFINGFVHSDPHPGNILVKKGQEGGVDILLLDHGLYAELSNEFRWEYSKLWLSILNKDKEGMRQHCEKLGVGHLYFLLACMKAYRDKEIPHLLPQISDVLENVNRHMLLILKTNDLMRGVEFTLQAQNRCFYFLFGAFGTLLYEGGKLYLCESRALWRM
ncbi:putative aarF domain-containing protein kinase 1 [Blattella germanica]|nr:putative aarF domain-containing protein kinase 1 [Blattella germanica]